MLEVRTADADGVPVVSLHGFAGAEVLERLAEGIGAVGADARYIIVDIAGLVTRDPGAVDVLLGALDRSCRCWSVRRAVDN